MMSNERYHQKDERPLIPQAGDFICFVCNQIMLLGLYFVGLSYFCSFASEKDTLSTIIGLVSILISTCFTIWFLGFYRFKSFKSKFKMFD